MTTVRFYRTQGRVTGFSCQGHSGCAEAGRDIVCAAVTSAVRLVECTINDVLHAGAEVRIDEKTAAITLRLPAAGVPGAEPILEGLALYLCELSKEYPDYLTVLEV